MAARKAMFQRQKPEPKPELKPKPKAPTPKAPEPKVVETKTLSPSEKISEAISHYLAAGGVQAPAALADMIRSAGLKRDQLRLLRLSVPHANGIMANRADKVRSLFDFFLEDL